MTPSGEGDGDALKSKIELSRMLLPMQVQVLKMLLKLSMTKVLIQGKIKDHGESANDEKMSWMMNLWQNRLKKNVGYIGSI